MPPLPPPPEYQESQELSKPNPLAVMQPDEQIVCEIKRHPIGVFGIYLSSAMVLVILAIVAFVVVPQVMGSVNRTTALSVSSLLFVVVALITLGFVYVANKVYWGNRWIVTSDSITQITQASLFSKQSSQLSLGNLEDVTAEQNGILPHMLNYGLLRAETAGEKSKFVFAYCPEPIYYAQKILRAREAFEQGRRGEDKQRLYRSENAYQPASDSQASNDNAAQPAAAPPASSSPTPLANDLQDDSNDGPTSYEVPS